MDLYTGSIDIAKLTETSLTDIARDITNAQGPTGQVIPRLD